MWVVGEWEEEGKSERERAKVPKQNTKVQPYGIVVPLLNPDKPYCNFHPYTAERDVM